MSGSRDVAHFVAAFIGTQLVEVPIYLRLARVSFGVSFGASAITHPIVWFALHPLVRAVALALAPDASREVRFLAYGVVAESFAVVAEAVWLAAFGLAPRRAFVIALIANAASALVGLVANALTGWP